jgi:outer membrane protein
LFNPALRDFVRASHHELEAVKAENIDRRNQITQQTVLTYLELVKWETEIEQLRKEHEDAQHMQEIEMQRVQAGVDSTQAGTEAELVTARAYLRITQAQGAIDVLRQTLSQLTGVPANALQTDPESVPALPDVPPDPDEVEKAEASNPSVLFAQDHAIAQSFQARGEHRSLWPSVDFASQYAVLAKFNNWLQFFNKNQFERNNATVGVVIRFPFFNPSQHAHAQAADALAVQANKQVQATKDQVSQEVLKLRRAVEQLQAADKVSELEYEIAQSNVRATEIKMNSGTATINEGALARSDLSAKYNALQDANFDLQRARVDLLRATGELQSWVDRGK